MRLISWNMAGAGFHTATSHDEAWRWLVTHTDFEVAMLQESIPPEWIRDTFPVVIHNPKYPKRGKYWGNTILCRENLYDEFILPVDPLIDDVFRGATTIAQPKNPDGQWIVNIHSRATALPSAMSKQLRDLGVTHCHPEKIWEVEVSAHFLQSVLMEKRFVFGGDLNSGYLFDEVYRYNNNKILFENMRQQGYIDLRLAHSATEQQTYFKEGKGPYQLDHLYGDALTAKRTTSWQVLTHVAVDLQLSDHAPVLIELG
jgi:exonuclease III